VQHKGDIPAGTAVPGNWTATLRVAGYDHLTVELQMSEPRIIKKYPNRRLYDTAISSYITLEDVKKLVLERAQFHVIDARSGEDITRGILLQIISEQEEQGNPIFTTEVLAHIIRFYGDTLQGMMGSYLETSLQSFVDQQHLFREQMRDFMGKNPLTMISDLTERNLAIWRSMNDHFYRFQSSGMDNKGNCKDQESRPKEGDEPSSEKKSSK
jgi:polyhydroxyalkanoate synthesis repressor PhaR